jgi:hypothetical protein
VGCDWQTVASRLAHYGIRAAPNRKAADQLRQMYERDGLSIVEIAQALDVHKDTARRRLVAANIPLRPRGRRPCECEKLRARAIAAASGRFGNPRRRRARSSIAAKAVGRTKRPAAQQVEHSAPLCSV